MRDFAVIIVMLIVFGVFLAGQDYLARRRARNPTQPIPVTAPEFDALERVVTKALEEQRAIVGTVASEVAKATVEGTRVALEGMMTGASTDDPGASRDTDEPGPPDVAEWTDNIIPDWVDATPFPNPPKELEDLT